MSRDLLLQEEPGMDVGLFESVPILGVYVGIAAMMLASSELGFMLGART